ncbi:MAG: hypothetical protein JEZ07_02035 [Phycisphaerae bacterium]|nr:hypothetical protein [Phycisphaerae bacterium]
MNKLRDIIIDLFCTMDQPPLNDPLSRLIFAELYLQPGPTAMEDVAKATGLSLASVSNKTRILESRALVSRTTRPGTRKTFLQAQKNLLGIWQNDLLTRRQRVDPVLAQLPEIIGRFQKVADDDCQKQQLRILRDYYDQICKIEEIYGLLLVEITETVKNQNMDK